MVVARSNMNTSREEDIQEEIEEQDQEETQGSRETSLPATTPPLCTPDPMDMMMDTIMRGIRTCSSGSRAALAQLKEKQNSSIRISQAASNSLCLGLLDALEVTASHTFVSANLHSNPQPLQLKEKESSSISPAQGDPLNFLHLCMQLNRFIVIVGCLMLCKKWGDMPHLHM
ncbi:hypothetical protein L7F22_021700 [Adiantum nelumboides]|nr:hypothetical protein [Adiantum nelumboides]